MDATVKSFLVCALYGFISISITFFNKAVLASYSFPWPNLMTLFQMLCSLMFLVVMKWLKLINYPSPTLHGHRLVAPLSIAFVGMVLTGLAALKYLNIPMFNALRRATTLITMIGESYLLDRHSSSPVQLSVWMMIIGAGVAGIADLDFSAIGYFLVALNCVFTAGYLLYIAKFGETTKAHGLNTFGLMWYNNVQSLPIVFAICLLNGDLSQVRSYPYLYDWDFILCFLFQSTLAFMLNYSIFLCTQVNSALATSVTGQIKNIATTAVGYVTFGDVTYSPLNVLGLILGVVASGWYSLLKYWESEHKKKSASSLLPTTSPTTDKLDGTSTGAVSIPLLETEKHMDVDPAPSDDEHAVSLTDSEETVAASSTTPFLNSRPAHHDD